MAVNLDPSFELKREIKKKDGVLWDKRWAMSFSILFNFEIDNERNNKVICQWLIRIKLLEPLIKWGENFYWEECHSYMLMFDLHW